MVNPEHLTSRHGSKLDTMREVTRKTGYETALTVCSLDGDPESEHSKQPVIGDVGNTRGSTCFPGTDADVTIHTHNESPVSAPDLRRLSNDDEDHCVIINDVEGRENGKIRRRTNKSMLVCMEADNLASEDIEYATRDKGEGKEYFNEADVERLQEAGVTVKIRNLSEQADEPKKLVNHIRDVTG